MRTELPRALVEIVWALIPAIVLIFLLTATWIRVRENAKPKPGMMMAGRGGGAAYDVAMCSR